MRHSRKAFAVIFSLLLVFLMIPAVPDMAYADETDFSDIPYEKISEMYSEAQALYASLDLYGNRCKEAGTETPSVRGEEPARLGTVSAIGTNCFHDATLPDDGWITIDKDGDGHAWRHADELGLGIYSLNGDDSECIMSASYMNGTGALHPDNWLVSPAVTIPQNTQLHFYIGAQDSTWYEEHYGIYISTSSQTDTSSFTELYTNTLDFGGGQMLASRVDLTAYAGKTVYIAFRHFNTSDMYYLLLDGMGLSKAGTDPVLPGPDPSVKRVYGQNRYQTSIEVAKRILRDTRTGQFENVIIATGDDFPDALAGSALSTAVYAPIILIGKKSPASIDNAVLFVKSYMKKNGTVVLLGGEGAVPESVSSRLTAAGYANIRISGKNRYQTNLRVLNGLYNSYAQTDTAQHTMLVCDGTNWPDAATASALGFPIMLVGKNGLTADQNKFLQQVTMKTTIDFVAIGGPGAVSQSVLDQFSQYDKDHKPERIAGSNRAETAVAVARAAFGNDIQTGTFAYGVNFPDCISGGLMSFFARAPILYGDSSRPESYYNADLPYISSAKATRAFVLGGPGLISDEFAKDLLLESGAYAD